MTRFSRTLILLLLAAVVIAGCHREKGEEEEDAFSFVVYPGARYLPQLTDLAKKAHKIFRPNEPEAPPTAIYDTDAPLETVAQYYVKSYGYEKIAADATNNLSAAKPQAYRRTGDLQADQRGIEPVLKQLGLTTDTSKAVGAYEAVEIAPKSNRPRVTIQRPYFDVTTSQVVNRTIILMSR